MKSRLNKAQEAMEFILITVLIFFTALFSMIVFGEKIAAFFKSDSSVAKSAMADPAVLSSANGSNFLPDYSLLDDSNSNKALYDQYQESLSQVSVSTPSAGTVTITIGDIKVENIPEDLSGYIQTSGSSGGTDQIASAMNFLVADLQTIQAANPDDAQLQAIIDKAKLLADSGYLLSDAEEWFEVGAKRLESKGQLELPKDNRLCQDGTLRTDKSYNCDYYVSEEKFLFTYYYTLKDNLDNRVKELNKLNDTLQSLSDQYNNPQVAKIIDIIGVLTTQMDEIAQNVKNSVNVSEQDIKNYQDLLDKVASKTTDLKTSLIDEFGNEIPDTSAATNSVSDPAANSSI